MNLWGEGPPGAVAELGCTGGADVGYYGGAVHAFAEAGAIACKIQMLVPDLIASPQARPYWHTTRYADTQAESFALQGHVPHDGWGPVREACEAAGVGFVATPFDLTALDPLADLAPDAVKIASGDITWKGLLTEVGSRFDRVILSTGASTLAEVADALRWLKPAEVLPLACSLEYPTRYGDANLARVAELSALTGQAGYSDHLTHVGKMHARWWGRTLGSVGVRLAEKHCAISSDRQSPDLDMALGPELFAAYVGGLADGYEALGTPGPHPNEDEARTGARRAIHILEPLPAGHVLTADDLKVLRPCPEWASPPSHAGTLVGVTLTQPCEAGVVVAWTTTRDSVSVGEIMTRPL